MKPSIPQGTRDFSPDIVRKRNYIFNTIKSVFELYGFEPLETPAFENLETLLGKYGEEGDKLIFKILNNGLNNPAKKAEAMLDFENVLQGKNVKGITERALRYDLTIPFARYIAMNHGRLTLPFRRYQVQPVWRADRPQKGRYREFYQCDADVVGSYSLLNDAEFVLMYAEVFKRLKIDVEIKVNSRKILKGIMQLCGLELKEERIIVIIDKTDKIGIDGVKNELENELENEENAAEKLERILKIYSFKGNNAEKIGFLKELLKNSQQGKDGVAEIEYVLNFMPQSETSNLQANLKLDLTLARGLNYYTGLIYEVKANKVQMGSIGGGGRYDDLTGLFGVPNIPGVGISFGVDRIYDVMEELQIFPAKIHTGTKALFFNMGAEQSKFTFEQLQALRSKGISAEVFHEAAKMDKQFKYASKKNIPFAIIIGSKEMADKSCVVKDLAKGEQQTIALTELENYFKDL